ncbi:hypothetical protein [Skermania piniformis]|uniref:Uncharacterized protein n=1 Tax=Skermania pinensis TaxID=39122 RepID=A0ABX8SA73_9ACTN|nr:hypothetical protein [Skermania piniformis]QXQ13892.1 hypothetical protein KV203_19345 [Skermania piniformis]
MYRFTNLTAALRDDDSPLRAFLLDRFPHVRPIQQRYRAGAGELLVPGGSADPATVGTAFDYLVRFALDAAYLPVPAIIGFGDDPAAAPVQAIVRTAQNAEPGSVEQARAGWALALCTDVYRRGLRPDSPLTGLLDAGRFTATELLRLASRDALGQLAALTEVADVFLLPELRARAPLALGPTFAASVRCAADADLIADGVLIDIKTRLGPADPRTGARSDRLPRADLYQLIGYALFDSTDRYGIHEIGLYSARYGYFPRWPICDVLAELAGGPVDLAGERRAVARLLGG